jgi:putative redox protein
MSDAYRVELQTVGDGPTALGSAGPFTLVADRPAAAGGGGKGFNGGQLLYREAETRGIRLRRGGVRVAGYFPARGSPSTPIEVDVEIDGDAAEADLAALLDEVDAIAEIPNSLRGTTPVTIRSRTLRGA